MKEIFFIYGDNHYALKKRVNQITDKISKAAQNTILLKKVYLNTYSELNLLVDNLSNLSIFKEHIILNINLNIGVLKEINNVTDSGLSILSKLPSVTTIIFVLFHEKLDSNTLDKVKNSRLNDLFDKSIIFEEHLKPKYWQKEKMKEMILSITNDFNIRFTTNALDLFTECFKDSLDFIEPELIKLQTMLAPANIIDEKIIKELYIEKINIEDLYLSIVKLNGKQINKYIIEYNNSLSSLYLIAILQNKLRTALKIKVFYDLRIKESKLSDFINMHPYKIEKEGKILKELSTKKIRSLIFGLSQLEFKIKSGQIKESDFLKNYLINSVCA